MARVQRTSKGKTMKPNYFVFCEGETEVAYVEMLRAHYRLPIHIIPKRTLLNVTPALISRCKANYVETKHDMTFLMYDLDGLLSLADYRRYLGLYCFAPILVLNYGCCYIIQTNVQKSEVPIAYLSCLDILSNTRKASYPLRIN